MLKFSPSTEAHIFKVERSRDNGTHVTVGEVVRQPANKAVFVSAGYAFGLEELTMIAGFMSRPARCVFQKGCVSAKCPHQGTCKDAE